MNFQAFLAPLTLCFGIIKTDLIRKISEKLGIPVELHEFETSDGYLINLQRVPHMNITEYDKATKKVERDPKLPPKESVLLVHGLFCNGACFAIGSNPNGKNSLINELATADYDVWIFNARGTSFSYKHKTLDVKSPEFWNFSWHEIASNDVKESIDYILAKTGQPKMHYVGHSQGGLSFALLLSLFPDYRNKIKAGYLLAPAIYVEHMTSLVSRLVSDHNTLNSVRGFFKANNMLSVQAKGPIAKTLVKQLCSNAAICNFNAQLLLGRSSDHFNEELLYYIYKHSVDNVSIKQLVHFGQIKLSGSFQMFDYGTDGNMARYKAPNPPVYNLSNVHSPTHILYGGADSLVSPTDVRRAIKELPNVVKSIYYKDYNHIDFIFPNCTEKEINSKIIELMKMNKIH